MTEIGGGAGPDPGKGAGETGAEIIAAEAEIGGAAAEIDGGKVQAGTGGVTAAEIERTRRTRRTRSPKISGIERIVMILQERENPSRRMKARRSARMRRTEEAGGRQRNGLSIRALQRSLAVLMRRWKE
mmetsp:Transcript_1172/g.2539  ORF Transcript_1172/g.2539 Transcript_1172/m.2539 type:complete len:129 (+) Transcript_1172:576-962(+)